MNPAEVPPEFIQAFAVNVAVAVLCGGMIGLERQLRGKPAGLRVCILVVLTTSFFVTIAKEIDPGGQGHIRVLSSIITGVGFLGAGVIFRGGAQVSGITTATLIWGLAAVGTTIGFGYPGVALVAIFVVIGVLGLIDIAERYFPRLTPQVDKDFEAENR